MLRKGVYPYEYLYNQKNFTETLLPDNEDFSTNLNMEGNTNTDYRHAEKSMEKLLNEKPSEYHDLYVQSDILLLADVFEIFHNKCIKIYELDPAHFLSAPGLA